MDRRGIKGDRLVEKNRQGILKAFGTLLRRKGKTTVNVRKINEPYLDIVFTRAEPERRFIEYLCKKENAEKIDSWIKSRDRGFYRIEYSWRKGEHPKQQEFNPDFFIKIHRNGIDFIVVVEVKADNDDSDENKAKLRWTKQHFVDLNAELEKTRIKQKYIFHFLNPNSYSEFFEYLRDGRLIKGEFRSDLEDKLDTNGKDR